MRFRTKIPIFCRDKARNLGPRGCAGSAPRSCGSLRRSGNGRLHPPIPVAEAPPRRRGHRPSSAPRTIGGVRRPLRLGSFAAMRSALGERVRDIISEKTREVRKFRGPLRGPCCSARRTSTGIDAIEPAPHFHQIAILGEALRAPDRGMIAHQRTGVNHGSLGLLFHDADFISVQGATPSRCLHSTTPDPLVSNEFLRRICRHLSQTHKRYVIMFAVCLGTAGFLRSRSESHKT